jgi:hypothetical protein
MGALFAFTTAMIFKRFIGRFVEFSNFTISRMPMHPEMIEYSSCCINKGQKRCFGRFALLI